MIEAFKNPGKKRKTNLAKNKQKMSRSLPKKINAYSASTETQAYSAPKEKRQLLHLPAGVGLKWRQG